MVYKKTYFRNIPVFFKLVYTESINPITYRLARIPFYEKYGMATLRTGKVALVL